MKGMIATATAYCFEEDKHIYDMQEGKGAIASSVIRRPLVNRTSAMSVILHRSQAHELDLRAQEGPDVLRAEHRSDLCTKSLNTSDNRPSISYHVTPKDAKTGSTEAAKTDRPITSKKGEGMNRKEATPAQRKGGARKPRQKLLDENSLQSARWLRTRRAVPAEGGAVGTIEQNSRMEA